MPTKIVLSLVLNCPDAQLSKCLTSVMDRVDAVVISECSVVEDPINSHLALTGCRLPHRVVKDSWVSFEHKHQLSRTAAKSFAAELGWDLKETYVLSMEPHEILVGDGPLQLTESSYKLVRQTQSERSAETRLYKLHSAPSQALLLTSHQIQDYSAPRHRLAAYLITKSGEKEPFLLAESYRGLGEHDKAAKVYASLINGHDEVAWISLCRLAGSLLAQDKLPDEQKKAAVELLLKASKLQPDRAEPLLQLVEHYLSTKQHRLAHLFAKRALHLSQPPLNASFVHLAAYDYEPLYQLTLSSYYIGEVEEGFATSEKVILNPSTPNRIRTLVAYNERYYMEPLPTLWNQPLEMTPPLLSNGKPWFVKNASILPSDDGYTLVAGVYNTVYHPDENTYIPMSGQNNITTRNYLLSLFPDLKLKSQWEIIESDEERAKRYVSSESRVLGIEDMRIFKRGHELWGVGTTRNTNTQRKIQWTLVRINGHGYDRFLPLKSPFDAPIEKNWMPHVVDGDLFMLHSYQPFTVVKVDFETGAVVIVRTQTLKQHLGRLRGSTPPIPLDGGHLMLVHETATKEKKTSTGAMIDRRYYVHRFIWLDQTYTPRKLSRPFYFESFNTEYCTGMAWNGDTLLAPISLDDNRTVVYGISKDVVRERLLDL